MEDLVNDCTKVLRDAFPEKNHHVKLCLDKIISSTVVVRKPLHILEAWMYEIIVCAVPMSSQYLMTLSIVLDQNWLMCAELVMLNIINWRKYSFLFEARIEQSGK